MPKKAVSQMPKPAIGNKADEVVKHCLYMIATGKWLDGSRLPSIRVAEREWSVNRLTVQKAYRRLEQMGLVERKPKSGYYIAGRPSLERISRHRYELDRLYDNFAQQIKRETALSVAPVFQYLARMAEIRTRERPECVFAECTSIQAEGHAREIYERLAIPVLPLTTTEIGGLRTRIPASVRTILTSHFHLRELKHLEDPQDLSVHAVPIEVSPDLGTELQLYSNKVVLLETEESMAQHIASDASSLSNGVTLPVEVVGDPEAYLESELSDYSPSDDQPMILLSPRLWGAINSKWRYNPRVRPVSFIICESAWPAIADAIGLPLGAEVGGF